MNFIKWLEINSDIKLGKLKTEIKKDDVIVVKSVSDIGGCIRNRFMEELHKIFPDNLIIFIPNEIALEKLDEKAMNRAGWIRK